jgi:hypothetical protein
MRTIYIRIALAALMSAAVTTGASAQDRSALLPSIEVKRLAANDRPADHARLRDHFAALADKYTNDARRDRQIARVMIGNPNHPPAVSPGSRWMRLPDSAEASAVILRDLSAHHDRLAAGRRSDAPPNSARFEAGYGAPAPSASYVHELASGARTRADHLSLADYFTAVAETETNKARKQAAAAQAYRGPISRAGSGTPASHYDLMAERFRDKANQARAEAAKHRQLAQAD